MLSPGNASARASLCPNVLFSDADEFSALDASLELILLLIADRLRLSSNLLGFMFLSSSNDTFFQVY